MQRASVVRNSWVTKVGAEEAGFIDKASWEAVERKGNDAIKDWIGRQLVGTGVTAVLIGPETCSRPWVCYELQKSYERGNGLLGIYLHNIKDFDGNTDRRGDITFGELGKDRNGNSVYFFSVATTYDWIIDKGYDNVRKWIEDAAKRVGK